jgi:hypothetical protein
MPLKLENKKEPPVSEGVHQAICYGVVDLGTQPPYRGSKDDRWVKRISILFELPFERIDIKDKGNLPRGIQLTEGQFMSQKANLRKHLEGLRGKAFTEEDLKGFDPGSLIGANCQLNVYHKNGYANIKTVTPLAKGMAPRQQENPKLYFALSDQPDLANIKYPANMPEWIRKLVEGSEEVIAAKSSSPGSGAQFKKDEEQTDNIPY